MLRNTSRHIFLVSKNSISSVGASALRVPVPTNDENLSYLRGSPERAKLEKTIAEFRNNPVDIPVLINGKEYRDGPRHEIRPPYDTQSVVGHYYEATREQVREAIAGCIEAQKQWARTPAADRLAIFLRCAELLRTDFRPKLNAATILGQGKNFLQAEIDSASELIDFWRFNCYFAQQIYEDQPVSSVGTWNITEYRPLEGFVYAVSPFNFTAIGGNLASAPVMLGNVCLWKPSKYAMLSGYWIMQIYKEAGLPDGVINFVNGDPVMVTEEVLSHPDFAGIHYTGSTPVFQNIWKTIGENLPKYKNYPRIVGETGGKDYIFAHSSSKIKALATALVRGAFEYCGQKCSAASRAFIPASIWEDVKKECLSQMKEFKMGNPEKPETFLGAVIHRDAFDRCKTYIKYAKDSPDHTIIAGGNCDDSKGYFVEPTIILTTNPKESKCFNEEIFAPILTIYVYEDAKLDETLALCESHPAGLTGAIFAQDRYALRYMMDKLPFSAGNFYINDKPTGAVVGQQPFGGSRLSGTNDKAGSYSNLTRWLNTRSVKENFNPPTHFAYPYMKE